MSFLKRLFGKKDSTPVEAEVESSGMQNVEEDAKPQSKMVPISSVNSSTVPEGNTVLYQSEIPAYCLMGDLIYEKKYVEAINMGLELLKETPNDPGVHINLMDAYFKSRDTNPEYFDKSTYHAKRAILCGHNTGYAEDRLAKNLDKKKLFHQSLQLLNLILDNPEFHFSTHGMGNGIDFNKRRENVLKKMDKAADSEADILFTPEEIAQIIQSIKDNDAEEEAQRRASAERIAKLEAKIAEDMRDFSQSLHGKL